MGLTVQQALLRHADIEAAARAGDGHIHQAALFFEAVALGQAVFAGKQALFHAAEKHGIEFEPFGGVHRHQLQRVIAFAGLVFTRFERGAA